MCLFVTDSRTITTCDVNLGVQFHIPFAIHSLVVLDADRESGIGDTSVECDGIGVVEFAIARVGNLDRNLRIGGFLTSNRSIDGICSSLFTDDVRSNRHFNGGNIIVGKNQVFFLRLILFSRNAEFHQCLYIRDIVVDDRNIHCHALLSCWHHHGTRHFETLRQIDSKIECQVTRSYSLRHRNGEMCYFSFVVFFLKRAVKREGNWQQIVIDDVDILADSGVSITCLHCNCSVELLVGFVILNSGHIERH